MNIKRFLIFAITALVMAVSCDQLPGSSVPVETIELNISEATLTVGETLQLSAEVLPEDALQMRTLTWKSSDASVAAVDTKGLITAVAEGSATITASVGDKSSSCNVIVIQGSDDNDDSDEANLGGGEHEGTTEEDILT